MAKAPQKPSTPAASASKSTGAQKGTRPPTGNQSRQKTSRSSGRPTGIYTWIAVGVVVLAVLAIVLVKITNGSSKFVAHPISSSIESDLTSVSMSTFNAVGVSSPAVQVNAPVAATQSAPMLEWADSSGVKRPTVFYFGAEFCPYCAAERWPYIIATSRFGTWSNLYTMLSAANDIYPNTPTFTFLHAGYTSKYINMFNIENEDRAHGQLQQPNADMIKVLNTYNRSSGGYSYPFVTFGNQRFVVSPSFSPSALSGSSREQIAAILNDPTNPLGQGIISAANYLSASICHIDGQQPSDVCMSSGVKAAAAKMKL
jgi:hypothetical protein